MARVQVTNGELAIGYLAPNGECVGPGDAQTFRTSREAEIRLRAILPIVGPIYGSFGFAFKIETVATAELKAA